MKRTEIPHSDVFFSWTGVDRAMKNKIVDYLRKNNITCTESDYACSGDFQQWSREAVSKSTVFLLLYTKDTPHSKYVPVEIEAFMELEDPYNRCVPVVTDFGLYAQNLPKLACRESAVILDNDGLNEKQLEAILTKVRSLICNRLFAIYRHTTAPAYMRFVSLLREMRMTVEFDHEKLYINRSVTDEAGQTIPDEAEFCKPREIFYLYGPAGSGKTCYIDQLRNAADENTLVLMLPCKDLLYTKDIFDDMYTEFCRYSGNRDYYSKANFKGLLAVKHLLLVLDGLDEIGTEEGREAVFKAARDYYAVNAGSTTLFITSRSSEGADMWKINGQTPRVMRLSSLEEDQIKAFGDNLFLLLDLPDKSADFYVSIRDLAEEIRTNPLMLTQLAIVYKVDHRIPQTVVGIYDAVCEIILKKIKPDNAVPAAFDDRIFGKLSDILNAFSAERYRLQSQGREKTTEQIFSKILEEHHFDPEDAPSLIRYLQDRSLLVGNEFYHKILLEYFTAVYYFKQCFSRYDELNDRNALTGLFSHYNDPYWSAVLQMFLVKADSRVDADTTAVLYRTLMALEITDFTLLFDTCQMPLRNGEAARKALLTDILTRSAEGVYPPYGPLFWYVPEYELYGALLSALTALQEAPCYTRALALTRDVCWIFGKYHTAEAVNHRINGKALLAKAALTGIRRGLCELFYQGSTDFAGGKDIYPRCFNVAEALRWLEEGVGIYGRMGTAFEDELGLYSHEMLRQFGGEWAGIVSAGYDPARIEEILPSRSCKKLCGLFLSPATNTEMQKLAINDSHLRVIYLPENTTRYARQPGADRPFVYQGTYVDKNGLMRFRNRLSFPEGITEIGEAASCNGSTLTSVTIPNSVRVIGSRAFSGCSALTSIEIPEGVTKIGSWAFSDCSSLISATIPDSITTIEDSTFFLCSSLTSVKIPECVTKIGKEAFFGCSSLASIEIPKLVTEIGSRAFSGCSSLASIKLPDSVTTIQDSAFSRCSSLVSVKISDNVTTIEDSTFSGCSSLTSIEIPELVTEIGSGAFSGCSSLASIKIPDSVIEIGWIAFSDCSSLVSIKLPEYVTTIEEEVFSGCSSLTSIKLPEYVTTIGEEAFSGCSSLNSIKLPECVTEIGEAAFSDCSSLTSVRLPDQLRRMSRNVFYNCTALECISNCPAFCNREFLGVSEECVIVYREAAPKDIVFQSETEILPGAFRDREDIICISLPDGVTRIGASAFSGCSTLTSIKIPEHVTEIGEGAFFGCSSLVSIQIPERVTEIGEAAFSGCSSLTSIEIPERVTRIEDYTFSDCNSLTSITIPQGVDMIGACAFSGCSSIVSIQTLKNVTRIEAFAFSDCDSLASIEIPKSMTEIAWGVFSGCSSLLSVQIPGCVTKIGDDAFSRCSSLASIKIPDSVTEIGMEAFSGCSSLTSIKIPEHVTEIAWGVFSGCNSLTSISIPECATEIREEAFSGCSSLTSLVIPRAVRVIGNNAFAGCTGLREITLSRRFEDDLPRIFEGVDLSEVTVLWC